MDASCLRRTANWSLLSKHHKFDKSTFDPEKLLQDMPVYSPKTAALLDNIKELDERDIKEHGKHFKHFVFSEVKQGGYGVKVVAGAMIASGYKLAYDNKLRLLEDQELLKTRGENLFMLSSTDVFSNAISAKKKKEILDKFNQRPDNSQGDLVRFILLDAGFKEGIDLFDVKYVHIFEPQTSKADMKQAIGRATRLCGQKGLEFHPTRGWPLRVFLYDMSVPPELASKYGSDTLFNMYLKNSGIDLSMLQFVEELEKYSIIGAIDYELTKNVHRFEIEDDEFHVPLHKLFQEGGGSQFCRRKCGLTRPTKSLPVSIPLFATVMAAQGKVFPHLSEGQRARVAFCELFKKDKEFCNGVKEALKAPVKYVKKNNEKIAESIKNGFHTNMPRFNKMMFMRFYRSISRAEPEATPQTATQATPQAKQAATQATPQTTQATPQAKQAATQATPQTTQAAPQTKQATPQAAPQTTQATPQAAPQATQAAPQAKQATPQAAAQAAPQTKQAAPQATQAAPQAKQAAPQTTQAAPQTKQAAPQATQAAPQTKQAAPQAAPQAKQATPQATQAAPQAKQAAPQATQAAPQAATQAATQAAPQAKQATPQAAPQATQAAPQTKQAAPQTTQAAPQAEPQATPNPFDAKAKSQKTPTSTPFKESPKEEALVIPAPDRIMNFLQLREFVRNNYIQFMWPRITLENMCVPKAGSELVKFTPTQDMVRNYFTPQSAYKGVLLWHSVGTGKCWKKDTPILMYSGATKMVQDIQVGDLVMGDDSTPRTVLSLGSGSDTMYEVKQEYGDAYVVNSEHILCLKDQGGNVVEIEVKDYLALTQEQRDGLKGYKEPVTFRSTPIVFDSYDIGYEFDGKIPRDYKVNTQKVRLQVLAGIVDSIGVYNDDEYSCNSTSTDLLFLARSLGFAAWVQGGRTHITGKGIEKIPVRNPHLQAAACSREVLEHSISVSEVGRGDYYGFTLDCNNRLLMGDCTVTHNTCCAIATATSSFEKQGYTVLWVTRTTLKSDIWKNMFDQVCSMVVQERMQSGQKIPPEFAKRMRLLSKSWKIKPISYKQFSNLVSGKNQLYKELVAINGKEDPLKKTLLIIDEAHKLYGGSDLSAVEKPNMPKLQAAIDNSYSRSGDDSVKVMLMTATPITNDPMELVKLVNLCREEKIPSGFKEFAARYLNEDGKFTKKGSREYLDNIAGTISYLSREKDARQFSQPTIIPMNVPMSKSRYGSDAMEELERNYDRTIENNSQDIAYSKNAISNLRAHKMQYKKEARSRCEGLGREPRAECTKEVEYEVKKIEAEIEDQISQHSKRMNDLAKHSKDLRTELQAKKKLAKDDPSQQAIIETRCPKKVPRKK